MSSCTSPRPAALPRVSFTTSPTLTRGPRPLTNMVADRLAIDVRRPRRQGHEGIALSATAARMGTLRGEVRDRRGGALKMMNHRLLYAAGAIRRFKREAAMLQTLDHVSIPRLWPSASAAHRTQVPGYGVGDARRCRRSSFQRPTENRSCAGLSEAGDRAFCARAGRRAPRSGRRTSC